MNPNETLRDAYHRRPLILRRFAADVAMIEPAFCAAILAFLVGDSGRGDRLAEHPGIGKYRELARPKLERAGPFAIVPMVGALAANPDPFEQLFYGVEDTNALRDLVDQAAADSDVSGILLKVDSPGGFYTGGPELADAVRSANKAKPVVTWTGGTMASLAYWAGVNASKIVASRSASVGSIGVYSPVVDVSQLYASAGIKVEVFTNKEGTHKAAGFPGTSLSDEQRAEISARVQAKFREFRGAVKDARPGVDEEAMRGQVLTGQEARKAGLVDKIGGMDFALSTLRAEVKSRGVNPQSF